mmetsp:Transcript_53317/g.122526  ORF Transcript_53317/g.122526 Transcript_53317/m.122526 type:complete len:655 (+) Transcript_53317:1018-2982(+)
MRVRTERSAAGALATIPVDGEGCACCICGVAQLDASPAPSPMAASPLGRASEGDTDASTHASANCRSRRHRSSCCRRHWASRASNALEPRGAHPPRSLSSLSASAASSLAHCSASAVAASTCLATSISRSKCSSRSLADGEQADSIAEGCAPCIWLPPSKTPSAPLSSRVALSPPPAPPRCAASRAVAAISRPTRAASSRARATCDRCRGVASCASAAMASFASQALLLRERRPLASSRAAKTPSAHPIPGCSASTCCASLVVPPRACCGPPAPPPACARSGPSATACAASIRSASARSAFARSACTHSMALGSSPASLLMHATAAATPRGSASERALAACFSASQRIRCSECSRTRAPLRTSPSTLADAASAAPRGGLSSRLLSSLLSSSLVCAAAEAVRAGASPPSRATPASSQPPAGALLVLALAASQADAPALEMDSSDEVLCGAEWEARVFNDGGGGECVLVVDRCVASALLLACSSRGWRWVLPSSGAAEGADSSTESDSGGRAPIAAPSASRCSPQSTRALKERAPNRAALGSSVSECFARVALKSSECSHVTACHSHVSVCSTSICEASGSLAPPMSSTIDGSTRAVACARACAHGCSQVAVSWRMSRSSASSSVSPRLDPPSTSTCSPSCSGTSAAPRRPTGTAA